MYACACVCDTGTGGVSARRLAAAGSLPSSAVTAKQARKGYIHVSIKGGTKKQKEGKKGRKLRKLKRNQNNLMPGSSQESMDFFFFSAIDSGNSGS